MGVPELLKRLDSHKIPAADMYEYLKDTTVGVDGMVWLHLFVVVHAEAVIAGNFDDVVRGFAGRLRKLMARRISVVPVFDGAGNDAKAATAAKRKEQRQQPLERLSAALAERVCSDGQDAETDVLEAETASTMLYADLSKQEIEMRISKTAAHITVGLVDALLKHLRRMGFPFLCAPYEADHQLVYLSQHGIIDFVMTVDSDLLCHSGLRIVRVLQGGFSSGLAEVFDLRQAPGSGKLAKGDLGHLIKAAKASAPQGVEYGEISARVCLAYGLLAGNDYAKFQGVGPGTAFRVLKDILKSRDPGDISGFDRIVDARHLSTALVEDMKPRDPENARDEFERKITLAHTAFTRGLVFHVCKKPEERLILPLDASDAEIPTFLGEVVRDAEEAALLASGLRCRRADCKHCRNDQAYRHQTMHQLIRDDGSSGDDTAFQFVMRLDQPGSEAPSGLTYDMLPGSYLSDAQILNATGDQLKRWLQCRNVPAGRGDVASLRQTVMNMRENEKEGIVKLFCPDGRSLVEHLVLHKKIATPTPQHDKDLFQLVLKSADWETDLVKIKGTAPVLTEQVLRTHFAAKDVNPSGEARVLVQGFRRLCRRAVLNRFAYLAQIPSKPDHCAFRINCPRSMNSGFLRVVILCKTTNPPPERCLRRVQEVIACWCDPACPVGKAGLCVHASALLHVVRDLERPPDVNEESSPTSKECAWNKPAKGPSKFSARQELGRFAFKRQRRTLDDVAEPDSSRRKRNATQHDSRRSSEFQAVPSKVLAAVRTRIANGDEALWFHLDAMVDEFRKTQQTAQEMK